MMSINIRGRVIVSLLAGITIGIVIGVGVAVRAAWQDPTQAPPNGGYLRAGTGTQAAGDCTASNGGRLEYNSTSGNLYVCDAASTTWDIVGSQL